MRKVLILCTGNSCRSQMAEGLLLFFSADTKVYSAGTKPEKVNPFAIKAMDQIGIDISENDSNHVDEYTDIDFDSSLSILNSFFSFCFHNRSLDLSSEYFVFLRINFLHISFQASCYKSLY